MGSQMLEADYNYRIEYGQLYLYRGDKMQVGIMDNELAFLYAFLPDQEAGARFVLHKHGEKNLVVKHYGRYLGLLDPLPEPSRSEMKAALRVISLQVMPEMLNEVNRVITTSGYLEYFFKKYGILEMQPLVAMPQNGSGC